jgi:cell division protein FtsW (lipid II flippase)
MRRLVFLAQDVLMLLLPALVLLTGAAGALRSQGATAWLPGWLAIAAALAPVVCGLLLRVIAPGADLLLIAACGMLMSISAVVMLQIALVPGGTQPFFQTILERHLAFVVAAFGAVAAGAVLARFAPLVRRYPYLTAAAALTLIGSTMLIGTEVNGAKLWIVIGPLRAQPAELARVLLAMFIAAYLYDRRHLLASSWRVGRLELPPVPYLVPVGGALVLALAALAVQNDLGMAALTALAAFAIIAGSLRSRWSVLAMGAAVGAVIWSAPSFSPRVQARVDNWLDPWRAPTGAGYQFIQGEYALSWGGVGGGRVTPDVRNVPEVQTDFILPAIGAQFGVLVSSAVLALLAVIVLRSARNALQAPTELEQYIAVALVVLLGLQNLLILGGVLRLMPLTGLTVPFVSYGGTSMLVTGFTIGIIVGIGAKGARTEPGAAEFVVVRANAYTA